MVGWRRGSDWLGRLVEGWEFGEVIGWVRGSDWLGSGSLGK